MQADRGHVITRRMFLVLREFVQIYEADPQERNFLIPPITPCEVFRYISQFSKLVPLLTNSVQYNSGKKS